MKSLITADEVESFNTRELYSEVISKFRTYNYQKLAYADALTDSLKRSTEIHEEYHTQKINDSTWNATEKRENLRNYFIKFENRIKNIKEQLNDDELIIFEESIQNRELDKTIMDKICRDPHKYYEVKKSCYIKVALAFGIIKLKEENEPKVLPMVAQVI